MKMRDITSYADRYGLVVRGGFVVADEDNVPAVGDHAARSLILFGNAGSSFWESFSASDEYCDTAPDPLNRWSERIGNQMAGRFGGLALFPFGGPPYRPFLQWAKKAESLHSSRLGMLIHPQYGLWHAYRFAIALPTPVDGMVKVEAHADICADCPDQPCLSRCPVDAFTGEQYKVEQCYGYLDENPGNSCLEKSCAARLACPQGLRFHYQPEHAKFHMAAFYRLIADQLGD